MNCSGIPAPRLGLALLACLSAGAMASARASARDPAEPVRPMWPPNGKPVKVPVARDVWVSAAGQEATGNNGGAGKWKLKGILEFTLFDADLSGFKGRVVTGALLHLRCASPDAPARRVSVSTVATPWVEGTGSQYARQDGSACFASPALGQRQWAYPGSTLLDAAWGKGHTIWRFAEASAPDKDGWQEIAIEPEVVAANVAGLAHGFAAMDDVGSEWSYKGGKFEWMLYLNRFFFSREQRGSEPYLEVWTDSEDRQPPGPVTDIEVLTGRLPAGEALVRWKTPADGGGGRTLGFHVTYSVGGDKKPVPRYLIPMAGPAGSEVRMVLQDLDFSPGQEVELSIAAVDSSGNVGPVLVRKVKVSATPRVFPIGESPVKPFEPSEKLPQVGGLRVAVLDLLDKVEARTGKMVPAHSPGYKGGNHLWSAEKKLIRLQAARNETVAFQVNLEGASDGVRAELAFPESVGVRPSVHRFDYVQTRSGMMPDAVLPLTGALPVPARDDPQGEGQTNASLLCEIYVPHEVAPGAHAGKLTLSAGGQSLELTVTLTVWEFTLPNQLSFIPEMNCYGTAGPTGGGLEYYRVAHAHRTCLNRLYYSWNGSVRDNAAPPVKGDGFDWAEYDRAFGRLFDGSAFADLPRKGEPVDLFYLPFNEHWPMDVYAHYRGSYWADEAFTEKYRAGFTRACAEFARHFNERKWHDTVFEFYLNNKVYYKRDRPRFRDVSAPWCFDEPANTQDFWALRWYGILFHQGVDPSRGQAKFWFRCDISRSQFNRDILLGVLDREVLGGANAQKMRMRADQELLSGPSYFTVYGSANDPGDSNLQAVVWSLAAWANGSTGVLPWQTVGTKGSWEKGENTCLFYPTENGPPAPSVRLKAFTRGQQDVEYLVLLGEAYAQPQYAVAGGLARVVNLAGRIQKTGEDDAGTARFEQTDPAALWALRTAVGKMVSDRKPPYRRSVVARPNPPTDMTRLPEVGYVTVGPKVPSPGPEMEAP